jgi:CubicO group peptidase (beta-lactamase class C family)
MKKYNYTVLPVTFIILAIYMLSCVKEDAVNRPFTGFTPLSAGDGWILSGPSAENIDSTELIGIYRDLYEHEKAWTLNSMLVFRNGRLVAESYLKSDNDRTARRAIWSCTKQVTAMVTGIAINEGFIRSVDDPISDYLPEVAEHPEKQDITISDLLTMQSGIFFDNGTESDIFRQHKTENSIKYILGNELKWEPGTHFQYNDGAAQLMSGIIQNATRMTMADYADKKLMSQLGISNYEWRIYSDGVTLGAFGLQMPPRELAKIAQCVCDSGKWNGKEVVPAVWLRQALDIKVPGIHGNIGFGYFWWVNKSDNYSFMWGHGGQYAFIYPEKRLLVVFTGLEQADDDVAFWYDDAVLFADRVAACAHSAIINIQNLPGKNILQKNPSEERSTNYNFVTQKLNHPIN